MEVKRAFLDRLVKKRYLLILFVIILVLLFYDDTWIGKWVYPVKYEEDILLSAAEHQIDPFLIAAIIRVESNFKSDLKSEKGAVGLMQLMPETAKWIVQEAGYSPLVLQKLSQGDVNIEIGAWYLKSLYREFEGNSMAVIAAYNAGPGNVKKWLQNGVWDGKKETINRIPFGETRHYIQRVLYYYGKYKKIYDEKW